MKYFLFDTNIYLDLVVRRNKCSNFDTYKILETILKHDDCAIIVPEIVKIEVFRHFDKELSGTISYLQKAQQYLEECKLITLSKDYEVTNDDKILEAKKKIREIESDLTSNFAQYSNALRCRLEKIFDHERSLFIPTDQEIVFGAMQRRIFKVAPFHKKDGEYADACIVETLVNIRRYLNTLKSEKIFFISRNSEDFSESEKKRNNLHPDILSSLKNQGLEDNVEYSNFLHHVLKKEFCEEYSEIVSIAEGVPQFECLNCKKTTLLYDEKQGILKCVSCDAEVRPAKCTECGMIMPIYDVEEVPIFYDNDDFATASYFCKDSFCSDFLRK